MRKHDYICAECGAQYRDHLGDNPTCCNKKLEPYYGNWEELQVGDSGNNIGENTYSDGRVRNFTAMQDPLTRMEIEGKFKDRGVTKLKPEQRAEFKEKLRKDGDSPKLREQILDARKQKAL